MSDPLGQLRAVLRHARKERGISQERAAELADISVNRWKTLEAGSRRTAIRLPADAELMDGVASAIGRPNGETLMREAGLI